MQNNVDFNRAGQVNHFDQWCWSLQVVEITAVIQCVNDHSLLVWWNSSNHDYMTLEWKPSPIICSHWCENVCLQYSELSQSGLWKQFSLISLSGCLWRGVLRLWYQTEQSVTWGLQKCESQPTREVKSKDINVRIKSESWWVYWPTDTIHAPLHCG